MPRPKGTNYENMPGKIGVKKPVPDGDFDIDARDKAGWMSNRGETYTHLTSEMAEPYYRIYAEDGEHKEK